MANLLLLKDLLPEEYKVLGTPSKVLIISPFKTPFGYLEAIVEDFDNYFEISNTDIPYQFELLGFANVLKKLKDFSSLPIKIDSERIIVKLEKQDNLLDLIKLAKAVDSFIKDLYDFVQNISRYPEIRSKLGVVEHLIFKFEELKKQQQMELKQKAKELKAEIVDTYTDLKSLVHTIDVLITKKKYQEAHKYLQEALEKLAVLDRLREEYRKITGKNIYSFHTDLLRSYIFQVKEMLEQIPES